MQAQRPKNGRSNGKSQAKPRSNGKEKETEEVEEQDGEQQQRRKLRRKYRNLIHETHSAKQDLIRPDSGGLLEASNIGDAFYELVKNPREAVLDAEFIDLISGLGAEQAMFVNSGFKEFDPTTFVAAVQKKLFSTEESLDDGFGRDDNDQPLDNIINPNDLEPEQIIDSWTKFGKLAITSVNLVPSLECMFGPLSLEPKARKERKKPVRDVIEKKQTTKEADNTQETDNETSKCVERLKSHLDGENSVNMFQFIFDPQSYSQTIENLFHFSFLLNSGHAQLKANDENHVFALPSNPPTEDDYTSGNAIRKQSVVEFDYDMFQDIQKNKNINSGYLPHRDKGELLSWANMASQPVAPDSDDESEEIELINNNKGKQKAKPKAKPKAASKKRKRKNEYSSESEDDFPATQIVNPEIDSEDEISSEIEDSESEELVVKKKNVKRRKLQN